MSMLVETLEERVQKTAKFLSDVTGLAIAEQTLSIPQEGEPDFMPLLYRLVLGNAGDQYAINLQINFSINAYGKRSEVKWDVGYNGTTLSQASGTYSEKGKLKNACLKGLLHALGGVDFEPAFMDFETYTVGSLNDFDKDSYFRNIYLVIMAHMKERGLQMPPILSKRADVRELMNKGAVDEVSSLLESLIDEFRYDSRCAAHMRAEAEEILSTANRVKQRRDPEVPLLEKITNVTTVKVPGREILPPYNILVVENEPPYGVFTSILAGQLANDGRYGATTLITEFMIAYCMDLCETGQISLVLFDWSMPSYGEALMFRGKKHPLFDMFYGDNQAVIDFSKGSFQAVRQDGLIFDLDSLREEAERLDIRQRWMDLIEARCASAGVATPPYHIVRSEAEFPNLARIVSEKLDNSINL